MQEVRDAVPPSLDLVRPSPRAEPLEPVVVGAALQSVQPGEPEGAPPPRDNALLSALIIRDARGLPPESGEVVDASSTTPPDPSP